MIGMPTEFDRAGRRYLVAVSRRAVMAAGRLLDAVTSVLTARLRQTWPAS